MTDSNCSVHFSPCKYIVDVEDVSRWKEVVGDEQRGKKRRAGGEDGGSGRD